MRGDAGETIPDGRAPFTLIFRGPKSPWAPESLWTLTAPDGAMRELYLSPIQTFGADHQDYQAVFN